MCAEISLSCRHRFSVYDCLLWASAILQSACVVKPSIVFFVISTYMYMCMPALSPSGTCIFIWCAIYSLLVLFTFLFHKYQVFRLKIVFVGPGGLPVSSSSSSSGVSGVGRSKSFRSTEWRSLSIIIIYSSYHTLTHISPVEGLE